MSGKLRDALNQLLGLIDNKILVFDESLEPSDISQAQYHIDKAVEAYEEPPPPDKHGEVCEILDELFAADADGDHREFNAVLARLRDWYEKEVDGGR